MAAKHQHVTSLEVTADNLAKQGWSYWDKLTLNGWGYVLAPGRLFPLDQ